MTQEARGAAEIWNWLQKHYGRPPKGKTKHFLSRVEWRQWWPCEWRGSEPDRPVEGLPFQTLQSNANSLHSDALGVSKSRLLIHPAQLIKKYKPNKAFLPPEMFVQEPLWTTGSSLWATLTLMTLQWVWNLVGPHSGKGQHSLLSNYRLSAD